MKISAALAMWLSAAFALVCFGVAAYAFAALPELANAEDRDMAAGYGWFWAFLGAVASACGAASWMLKEGKLGRIE